jgi:sialic acid synthase SpsE
LLRDCATIAHLCELGHRVGWSEARATRSHATIALAVGATVVEMKAGTGEVEADAAAAQIRGRIRNVRGLAEVNRRSHLLGYTPDELDQVDQMRPGLVAARAIPAGTALTRDLVALKAPASGLSVDQLSYVVGRRVRFDLRQDDPISFGILL